MNENYPFPFYPFYVIVALGTPMPSIEMLQREFCSYQKTALEDRAELAWIDWNQCPHESLDKNISFVPASFDAEVKNCHWF